MRADGVGQTLESSFAETVRGGLPFADHVPPTAVRAVVPAGVDAEDVRADACRALDERQLLLQARVAEQGVHVIVVDDESLRAFELLGTTQFASLGGTQRTALQCHFGDGLLPIAGRDREGDRHRFEIVAFTQLRIPMVVLIFRSERADVQTGIILTDLPLPRAIVLDLPHHGEVTRLAARALDLYDAGRLMHAGAPCGGGAHGESRAGLAGIDDLIAIAHRHVAQWTAAPIVFHRPRGVSPEYAGMVDFAAVDAHRHRQIQRRHRLDRQRARGAQPRVSAHCGQTRERFEYGSDYQPSRGVGMADGFRRGLRGGFGPFGGGRFERAPVRLQFRIRSELDDLQTIWFGGPFLRLGSGGRDESQYAARHRGDQGEAIVLRSGVGGTHFDDWTRITFQHGSSIVGNTAADGPHAAACNVAQSDGGIACRVEQHGNHAIAPFETPVLTGTYGVHCTGTAYHLRLLNRVQIPPDH